MDKNIGFLGKCGRTLQIVRTLEKSDSESDSVKAAIGLLKEIVKEKSKGEELAEDFNIGASIYLIAEHISRNVLRSKNEAIPFLDFLDGLQKMSIQSSSLSCANHVTQFSLTFDSYFKPSQYSHSINDLRELGLSDPSEVR